MNFNPDLSDENLPSTNLLPKSTSINSIIVKDSPDTLSMNNLLNITVSHIEDDKKTREEIDALTDVLNDAIPQMSIKELLEYLKVKIREREFHVDCVFKAYNFAQKTELAKEMLIGSERKERTIEAVNMTKVNNLLTMFNLNSANGE